MKAAFALVPVIGSVGTALGLILAGSVLFEYTFSWPGMGRLFYEAATERDYPVVLGVTFIGALLSVAGYLLTFIDETRRDALNRAKRDPFVIYMMSILSDVTLRRAGFEPDVALEGGEMDGVLRFAAAGLGVAVVPSLVIDPAGPLRAVRLAEPLTRTIAFANRRDRHLSRAGRAPGPRRAWPLPGRGLDAPRRRGAGELRGDRGAGGPGRPAPAAPRPPAAPMSRPAAPRSARSCPTCLVYTSPSPRDS